MASLDRFSAAAALLLPSTLLAAPPGKPQEPPTAVKETVLENGLRVLVIEDHAAPVATFCVFYKVGSRDEHTGNTGSAHLLEHMLFKGTERFKKGEIMAALDRIGAQWNANTFYDYTNYYETVPVEKLDFVMGLEADRMQHSLILDAERDLERIVVRNELERGENNPTRALTHDVWSAAFKAHPYHHPVIGWRSDVEGVPTSRLRDFYRQFYQPDNATAVLVGDIDAKEALALVRKHFGPIPGGHTFPQVYTTEPPQKGERRVVLRQAGDMKVVVVGYKAPPAADPDTVPLKILHLILSGELDLGPYGDPLDPGIGNRLYQALVEKELATRAGVDYVPLKDPSLFTLLAMPRPEVDHDTVEQALRAEVARFKSERVSPAELARAKSRATAAYALMQDGTSGRAMLLGYFATIADWRLADQFGAKVQAVTAGDIQRVAQKIFTDDQLTVGWFIPKEKEKREAAPQKKTGLDLGEARLPAHHVFDDVRSVSSTLGTTAAGASAPSTQKTERVVLPNGLVLLVRENHASPTFSLSGRIKAGAAFDPAGKPHTAALTAAALMRGTKKQGKLELARKLEDVGASLGYGSGPEEVTVSGRALARDLDRMLDLLAETLTQPAFPAEEVEKLKRETVARLKQDEDSTSVRARRALAQALYPRGHPYYVYNVDEAVAAVNGLDSGALAAFHEARYGADATVLAIVGDVSAKRVAEAAARRLSGMRKTGKAKVEVPDVPLRETAGKETVFVAEKPNVDVLLGHQGIIRRTDQDYYPALIGNFVFGGAPSARLFQEVRDRKGLSYGIYSSLVATHGAGPWTVSMTLNPQNVEKALPLVEEMAKELVSKGLSAEELAAAKETLVGSYKVGLSTNGGVAQVLATFESYGFSPGFVAEHPKRIEAVTREEVSAVLSRAFHPEKAHVVIAGTYPPKP
jgi:zinc protease